MNHKTEFKKVHTFLENEISSFKNPSKKILIMTQFQQLIENMQNPETSSCMMIGELPLLKDEEKDSKKQKNDIKDKVKKETKIENAFQDINNNLKQISGIVSSSKVKAGKSDKKIQINIIAQLLYKTYD